MKTKDSGHLEEMVDKQYMMAPNREEIDYSLPLAQIVSECLELRDSLNLSQAQLAERMGTKQSVISRFENLDGRLPSYDFIARLSSALGHSPGMTLYGDFMATVPRFLQESVKSFAEREGVSTRAFVAATLEQALQQAQTQASRRIAFAFATQTSVSPQKGGSTAIDRVLATTSDSNESEQFARAI